VRVCCEFVGWLVFLTHTQHIASVCQAFPTSASGGPLMEVGRGASEGVDAQVVPLLLLLVIRGDVRDGGGGWEFEQGRDPLA